METTALEATNVIRFPGARSSRSTSRDQQSFMDAIYASGSLPIAAEDHAAKALATRLTIFGFVVLDEVQADGTVRRLRPSEAFDAAASRPWRVSKRTSRYSIGDLPDSDRDLFAARPA
jgi:hypothetical protein